MTHVPGTGYLGPVFFSIYYIYILIYECVFEESFYVVSIPKHVHLAGLALSSRAAPFVVGHGTEDLMLQRAYEANASGPMR